MKRLILLSSRCPLHLDCLCRSLETSWPTSISRHGPTCRDSPPRISTQFGVPVAQVQAVIQTVREPADAFMVFQLGQFARVPSERVMEVYKPSRKKGWGAIAKELGIKPGSAEFHALKSGNLHFTGQPSGPVTLLAKVKAREKGITSKRKQFVPR